MSDDGQSPLTANQPAPEAGGIPALAHWTDARVALGRAGGSLPTARQLEFRRSHALAKDAVYAVFDAEALAEEIRSLGMETKIVRTRAASRERYLLDPGAGRALAEESLAELAGISPPGGCDLVVIASDGLSATAAHRQIVPLLRALLPLSSGWTLAPVMVAPFARVAAQDEIGHVLRAKVSLILLGERPGLQAPDSLGAYFTVDPRPGRTDADRHCVSNIRVAGLAPEAAALEIHRLLLPLLPPSFSPDTARNLPGTPHHP